MPVEAVQLVHRHHVQIAFDFVNAPEMAGGVEVHPAPGETGFVPDLAGGQDPALLFGGLVAIDGGRQQLPEGGQGVDDAAQCAGADDGVARGDGQSIGFRGQGDVLQENEPLQFAAFQRTLQPERRGHGASLAADIAQVEGEARDGLQGLLPEGWVAFDGNPAHSQRPLLQLGMGRLGDDALQCVRARTQDEQTEENGGQDLFHLVKIINKSTTRALQRLKLWQSDLLFW